MNTKKMTYCALLAALTAVFAQISIPLPMTPVPINLGIMAVMLGGAVLGLKYGTISQVIYILIGAVGIPVFSKFSGGFGHLAGPTGGYILGYLPAVAIIGILSDKWANNYFKYVVAMLAGLFLCYAFGTAWFVFSTHNPWAVALAKCVIPFIPGDIIKILVAALMAGRLKKAIK